jgi:PAS domain S-box-containing protein
MPPIPVHGPRESGPPALLSPSRSALLPALLFLGVGVAWIVFSDQLLLAMAPSPEAFARVQTWKGSLFVLATSLLLFLVLRTQFGRRNRQTRRLLASGERLRAQIENSPLAMVEFEAPEGLTLRITGWSPRAEELFGWEAAEVRGQRLEDLQFVHPDDREELNQVLERSRKDGGAGSIHRNRNLRKDGSVVHCEWYNSWIRNPEGEVVAMISLAQDVTWQREAVEEVRRLNRELEARVHRRTGELAQAHADLKAFTWSISHDLRAPVRAVLGFGEILERRHAEALPDEGRAYLGHILDAGRQMDGLIDALLRFARVDREAVELLPLDTGRLASDVAAHFQPLLSEPGGTLHIDAHLPQVVADPQRMESVLQNLVENAVKYRHPERPLHLRIEGRWTEDGPELRVVDNGLGIPPVDRERVFGLFERTAATRDIPGSGMGLAIVRRAMERMGGGVHLEDGPGGEGLAVVLRFGEALP